MGSVRTCSGSGRGAKGRRGGEAAGRGPLWFRESEACRTSGARPLEVESAAGGVKLPGPVVCSSCDDVLGINNPNPDSAVLGSRYSPPQSGSREMCFSAFCFLLSASLHLKYKVGVPKNHQNKGNLKALRSFEVASPSLLASQRDIPKLRHRSSALLRLPAISRSVTCPRSRSSRAEPTFSRERALA